MFAYNIGGSRPIIGVDGAHLRGPYSGILLTVVGKDGKNNIYPVAWAFVETKFSETLSWFLELLRNDIISVADSVTWIHEQDEFTYMSDRQNYFKVSSLLTQFFSICIILRHFNYCFCLQCRVLLMPLEG